MLRFSTGLTRAVAGTRSFTASSTSVSVSMESLDSANEDNYEKHLKRIQATEVSFKEAQDSFTSTHGVIDYNKFRAMWDELKLPVDSDLGLQLDDGDAVEVSRMIASLKKANEAVQSMKGWGPPVEINWQQWREELPESPTLIDNLKAQSEQLRFKFAGSTTDLASYSKAAQSAIVAEESRAQAEIDAHDMKRAENREVFTELLSDLAVDVKGAKAWHKEHREAVPMDPSFILSEGETPEEAAAAMGCRTDDAEIHSMWAEALKLQVHNREKPTYQEAALLNDKMAAAMGIKPEEGEDHVSIEAWLEQKPEWKEEQLMDFDADLWDEESLMDVAKAEAIAAGRAPPHDAVEREAAALLVKEGLA